MDTKIDSIILITGATDGIGKESAIEFAAMGAAVIVHGRTAERAQAAVDDVKKISGSAKVETAVADFTSLTQVRSMASDISKRFTRLDVLVNNAGVFAKQRVMTEDGLESTFQINHLAHFLLTHELLGLLQQSAPARIISVSSMAHSNAKLDFGNLQGEKKFGGYAAYSLSKLANILFTYELADRLQGAGVTVNCLHPGVIATKLLRAGFGGFGGSSVKRGAETIVFLATSSKGAAATGKYFVNREAVESSLLTYNRSMRKEFWSVSERLAGIT